MDMRAELKWVSHKMTPKTWVIATDEYNERLIKKQGTDTVPKNPRALLRKLGEMEPKLMDRIIKQDYSCKYCLPGGEILQVLTISNSKEKLRGVLAKAL